MAGKKKSRPSPTGSGSSTVSSKPIMNYEDSHNDNHGHSHSHGGNHDDEEAHAHSHASKATENFAVAIHGDEDDLHNDGCTHIAANTTECGHDECLSEDELKSLSARKTLIIVSIFCFTFMCIELVGGYISNSLAIMTDAAHLLSDLASFLVSIVAIYMARKPPTSSYSFGFHRAEIIGAIISVLLIWVLTVFLIIEAIERVKNPEPIDGRLMFGIATLGLLVNLTMGGMLMKSGHGHSHGGIPGAPDSHGHSHDSHGHSHDSHGHSHASHKSATPLRPTSHGHAHAHGHDEELGFGNEIAENAPLLTGSSTYGTTGSENADEDEKEEESKSLMDILHNKDQNINIRAAMIHVIGDAVQSVGVMLAALVIWVRPDWSIADPICTFLFSIIVLTTTVRILKDGFRVLMEGVPAHINQDEVVKALKGLPGVIRVHELHIWSLSMGNTALSVHLLADTEEKTLLRLANGMLDDRFGIAHTTIQIESLADDVLCFTAQKRSCVRDAADGSNSNSNSNSAQNATFLAASDSQFDQDGKSNSNSNPKY